MSDRCEPPEHLRGVDGLFWLQLGDKQFPAKWTAREHWWDAIHVSGHSHVMSDMGYRCGASVATPADVENLRVEVGKWRGVTLALDLAEAASPVAAIYKARALMWELRQAEENATTLRAELAAAREIEQHARDFLRWVTANGFTDPENMLVCAEWENLRTALGATP